MTEDGLNVCKTLGCAIRHRGGEMIERERDDGATVAELLLRDPEIVTWLEDYRHEPDETDDDEPPRAA